MTRLSAIAMAAGLLASSVISLQAQDRDTTRNRDQGPAARSDEGRATGEISSIDPATLTIVVMAEPMPGQAGQGTTIEYQAKDSTELGKFKVGDRVTGKVGHPGQTPARFESLMKASKDKNDGKDGRKDEGGFMGRDSARAGGAGMDTARAPRY